MRTKTRKKMTMMRMMKRRRRRRTMMKMKSRIHRKMTKIATLMGLVSWKS